MLDRRLRARAAEHRPGHVHGRLQCFVVQPKLCLKRMRCTPKHYECCHCRYYNGVHDEAHFYRCIAKAHAFLDSTRYSFSVTGSAGEILMLPSRCEGSAT
jgi:hypothetical protein